MGSKDYPTPVQGEISLLVPVILVIERARRYALGRSYLLTYSSFGHVIGE
jgi:hypothetical protein